MSSKRSILSLPLTKDTIASLINAGYATLGELSASTADDLSKELRIPMDDAQRVLSFLSPTSTMHGTVPMTQSVAALAQPSNHVSTGCVGMNQILGGGIQRGHILEISGPPGSPKELIAKNLVVQFSQLECRSIIVDCQNMIDLRALQRALQPDKLHFVSHKRIMDLPELMLFLEQLPALLEASQEDTLLVLSALSFPFQSPDLSPARRSLLLQKIKQVFAKATCASHVTVVITSHLATKLVNSDGSSGTFDTGVQGIMVPHLGTSYLPSGKAWRCLLAPDGPMSGTVRLLTSPQNNRTELEEPYLGTLIAQ